MQTIRSKLEKAGKQRELHRKGRKRMGFNTISLAGYTSAGKTTLFNKMTGETRDENKELFTTLSTTTRRITINQEPFLISDTVGFISKLPAYMIDAFKSTLEELAHTDVVIVVVDISDSLFDLKKKFASCMRTLSELGVEGNKLAFALNKMDMSKSDEIMNKIDVLNLSGKENWVLVSARTGENINKVKEMAGNIIENYSLTTSKNSSLKGNEKRI